MRKFAIAGAAFLGAAAAVALVNWISPFPHGWWLVAYLALVGGVAQLLLAPGLELAARRGAPNTSPPRFSSTEFVHWNAGTVIVAVADLMASPIGVMAGSVLLASALFVFAQRLRATRTLAARPIPYWVAGYVFLLLFLAASVLVGIVLSAS